LCRPAWKTYFQKAKNEANSGPFSGLEMGKRVAVYAHLRSRMYGTPSAGATT
jgi:hypothetical protein